MATWNISQTDYETANGFITTAHWTATEVDGEYSASVYGTCGFTGTPTIPYAQVTMQEVLDWCWASGVDKDAVEESLAANIALQKNPIVESGLPWATV
jgi:hypothetical protein